MARPARALAIGPTRPCAAAGLPRSRRMRPAGSWRDPRTKLMPSRRAASRNSTEGSRGEPKI